MTRNDWIKLIDESAWNLDWIDNLELFENQRFWLGYQNGNKGKKIFHKFIKLIDFKGVKDILGNDISEDIRFFWAENQPTEIPSHNTWYKPCIYMSKGILHEEDCSFVTPGENTVILFPRNFKNSKRWS